MTRRRRTSWLLPGLGDWRGGEGGRRCFTAEQIPLFVFIHPRSKQRDAHRKGCSKDSCIWMATEDETTQKICLLTWWEVFSRQEKRKPWTRLRREFLIPSDWCGNYISPCSFKDWYYPQRYVKNRLETRSKHPPPALSKEISWSCIGKYSEFVMRFTWNTHMHFVGRRCKFECHAWEVHTVTTEL